MDTNTTLIDTDILIDAGRGITTAILCLEEYEKCSKLAISVITQCEMIECEMIVGCRDKVELQKLEKILRRFEVITLDEYVSNIAIDNLKKYRLSHDLLIPDALIAAAAIAFQIPLLTKNQRDYRFIKNLNLLPYP